MKELNYILKTINEHVSEMTAIQSKIDNGLTLGMEAFLKGKGLVHLRSAREFNYLLHLLGGEEVKFEIPRFLC